jgi:hypothetical protein
MDAFVTKLRAGSFFEPAYALAWSTFLGGDEPDRAQDIAVGPGGAVYVTGDTDSTDFPLVNAYSSTHAGGVSDAFVTKLRSGGDALIYSTYLGGQQYDVANAITVDSSGAAYVAGGTQSADFPTTHGYDSTFNGGSWDAFVTKLQ